MKNGRLLWLDLETTGLDPRRDKILEVAAIATGWEMEPNINLGNSFYGIIKQNKDFMEARMIDEFWENHSDVKRKLIRNSLQEGQDIFEIERDLFDFIERNFQDGPVILAGNSIHFDRGFIKEQMPLIEEKLFYRMVDVSSWKIICEAMGIKPMPKKLEHSAFSDIMESMDEMRYYKQFIKVEE